MRGFFSTINDIGLFPIKNVKYKSLPSCISLNSLQFVGFPSKLISHFFGDLSSSNTLPFAALIF